MKFQHQCNKADAAAYTAPETEHHTDNNEGSCDSGGKVNCKKKNGPGNRVGHVYNKIPPRL
jgi:hypothetical protein